jgi:hypothetical protein
MKPKPRRARTVSPEEALETAYWLYWCGDEKYARNMLIRIADFVVRKDPNGQGEQKISLW